MLALPRCSLQPSARLHAWARRQVAGTCPHISRPGGPLTSFSAQPFTAGHKLRAFAAAVLWTSPQEWSASMHATIHGERTLTDLDFARLSKLPQHQLPPAFAELLDCAE